MRGRIDYYALNWNIDSSCSHMNLAIEFPYPTEQDISLIKGLYDGGMEIDVKISQHREKRSLNANAYFWKLCSEIARVIKATKEDVYEQMLRDSGVFDEFDEVPISIKLLSIVDVSKIGGHWMEIDFDGEYSTYLKLKGSSEYDTKEMSELIDMTVDLAKTLGIETLTPDEIERMKSTWKNSNTTPLI